jgi:hypothetical protein
MREHNMPVIHADTFQNSHESCVRWVEHMRTTRSHIRAHIRTHSHTHTHTHTRRNPRVYHVTYKTDKYIKIAKDYGINLYMKDGPRRVFHPVITSWLRVHVPGLTWRTFTLST